MGVPTYIFANTGQLVRLGIQTLDGYGDLVDDFIPVIQSIIYPDLSLAAGYPQNMTRLSVGFYAHGIQLPTGNDALGTYFIQVYWEENNIPKNEVFAINVSRPFGISSVSPI